MTEVEIPQEPKRNRTREAVQAEPVKKTRTRRGTGIDPMNIPKPLLESLWQEGIDLQWNTESVAGMPAVQETTAMVQQGWEAVTVGMFDGRLDYLAPKGHKGSIIYGAARLDWRPAELTVEAKLEERQSAQLAVRSQEHQLKTGQIEGVDPRMLDPTAKNAFSKITKERIPNVIPG